ncbi:MAG: DNA mismatch repair endonuclease MutL [Kofleriaceae bacterium]
MIAVLPPEVVDQIAAGEVVERPASVVKELVDNAIDAGARTISVEAANGGRSLLRITDDGCGMTAKDALLALERHATSKIRTVADLWGLASMGFRGEALPAIASVSRLTLTTRRAGDLAGTRVTVEGGRVISVTEVGAAPGTAVEVVDLLYNVPARLKFLKGEATEASHITDLVARLAMSHPELQFRLRHNGRTALDVPPDRDGFARARALLGARVAARMIASSGLEGGVRVIGYLGAPDLAQATARGVQLFVAKRAVRDRGLLHAVSMGYGELIARGRYPIAVVHIDPPANMVDINVHPQKHEVRFADPGSVFAAVRHVVQAGVASAPWRAEIGGPLMTAIASVAPPRLPLDANRAGATALSERYAAQLRQHAGQGVVGQASLGLDVAAPASRPQMSARRWADQVRAESRAFRAAEGATAPIASSPAVTASIADGSGPVDAEPPNVEPITPSLAPSLAAGFIGSLRYVGQLDLTYLVCEAAGELVLVAQHSAHERVELERLRTRASERSVAIQKLLFPATLEVSPAEIGLVEREAGLLARVGFEVEVFGRSTLAVKAVPAGIRAVAGAGEPTKLLRKLLASWVDDGTPTEHERLDHVLAEIACHSVVRAGDRLSPSEAEALLRSLDEVDDATGSGPHGRPVMLRLPLAEIARRFGR